MSALQSGWESATGWKAAGSPATPRPKVRAVPDSRPRLARVPFLLVLMGIFGLGMAGLLMLNTTLQGQAFEARTLDRQATELAYTQAALERQLDDLSAPQELARRASAMGLRPNPYPAFVVVPDGKIIGKPRVVKGDEVPSLIVKTPAQATAERQAAERARQAKRAKEAEQAAAAKKAAEAKKAEAEKKANEKKPDVSRQGGG